MTTTAAPANDMPALDNSDDEADLAGAFKDFGAAPAVAPSHAAQPAYSAAMMPESPWRLPTFCPTFLGPLCVVCMRLDTGMANALTCRGCQTRYCGKECQLYDWEHGHKVYCKAVRTTGASEVLFKDLKFVWADALSPAHYIRVARLAFACGTTPMPAGIGAKDGLDFISAQARMYQENKDLYTHVVAAQPAMAKWTRPSFTQVLPAGKTTAEPPWLWQVLGALAFYRSPSTDTFAQLYVLSHAAYHFQTAWLPRATLDMLDRPDTPGMAVTVGVSATQQWASMGGIRKPRGAWDSNVAYQENDIVVHGTTQYSCINGHTNALPTTPNSAFWEPMPILTPRLLWKRSHGALRALYVQVISMADPSLTALSVLLLATACGKGCAVLAVPHQEETRLPLLSLLEESVKRRSGPVLKMLDQLRESALPPSERKQLLAHLAAQKVTLPEAVLARPFHLVSTVFNWGLTGQ